MIALYLLEPWRLVLLVIPALLLALILLSGKKRAESAVSFSTLGMLEGLVDKQRKWKSATPVALVVVALLLGVFGFARPATNGIDAGSKAVVVLAIDVSLSMSAVDVEPSRIEVAKDAALRFVAKAPSNTLIGVVAFDSNARQIIAATDNKAAITRVVTALQPGTGTAIGEAIYAALDTISSAVDPSGDTKNAGTIILLSDGTTTTGRPDTEAAAEAQSLGIKINTIAFGTKDGTVVTPDGQVVPVPPDEQALSNIADVARGKSFTAATAKDLQAIYDSLSEAVVRKTNVHEHGDVFTMLSLLAMFAASVLSLRWFRRII